MDGVIDIHIPWSLLTDMSKNCFSKLPPNWYSFTSISMIYRGVLVLPSWYSVGFSLWRHTKAERKELMNTQNFAELRFNLISCCDALACGIIDDHHVFCLLHLMQETGTGLLHLNFSFVVPTSYYLQLFSCQIAMIPNSPLLFFTFAWVIIGCGQILFQFVAGFGSCIKGCEGWGSTQAETMRWFE